MNILERVLLWLGGYESYVVSKMLEGQPDDKVNEYKSVCFWPGIIVLLLTIFSAIGGYYLGAFLCEYDFIRIIIAILVALLVFVTESLLVRSYVTTVNVLQSILSIIVFSVLISFSFLSDVMQEEMQIEHDVMIEESAIYKLYLGEINKEQRELVKYQYRADSLFATSHTSSNVKWLVADEICKLVKTKRMSGVQKQAKLDLIKSAIKEIQQNSIATKVHLLFVSISHNSFISFFLYVALLGLYSSLLLTKYYISREFDERYGEFWDSLV